LALLEHDFGEPYVCMSRASMFPFVFFLNRKRFMCRNRINLCNMFPCNMMWCKSVTNVNIFFKKRKRLAKLAFIQSTSGVDEMVEWERETNKYSLMQSNILGIAMTWTIPSHQTLSSLFGSRYFYTFPLSMSNCRDLGRR
jgi:hypothetical protein